MWLKIMRAPRLRPLSRMFQHDDRQALADQGSSGLLSEHDIRIVSCRQQRDAGLTNRRRRYRCLGNNRLHAWATAFDR